MHALDDLFLQLKTQANVFHNGQYVGSFSVDTSGQGSTSFHIVTHGRCVIEVNGESYQLAQGDGVFLPSDSEHTVKDSCESLAATNKQESLSMDQQLVSNGTGLVCGNLISQHPLAGKLMQSLPEVIIIRADEHPTCATLMNLIMQEAKNPLQPGVFVLNKLADALFYILMRDHATASSGVLAAILHPRLRKAVELIHSNPSKAVSVEDLSACSAMSKSAFAKEFKEVVGVPPSEYQTQWRMLRAYRLLSDEGVTTIDAANRSGYETEASFSKAFKRVIGMGPGEVRKAAKTR